jgi:hypothetical protein
MFLPYISRYYAHASFKHSWVMSKVVSIWMNRSYLSGVAVCWCKHIMIFSLPNTKRFVFNFQWRFRCRFLNHNKKLKSLWSSSAWALLLSEKRHYLFCLNVSLKYSTKLHPFCPIRFFKSALHSGPRNSVSLCWSKTYWLYLRNRSFCKIWSAEQWLSYNWVWVPLAARTKDQIMQKLVFKSTKAAAFRFKDTIHTHFYLMPGRQALNLICEWHLLRSPFIHSLSHNNKQTIATPSSSLPNSRRSPSATLSSTFVFFSAPKLARIYART